MDIRQRTGEPGSHENYQLKTYNTMNETVNPVGQGRRPDSYKHSAQCCVFAFMGIIGMIIYILLTQ